MRTLFVYLKEHPLVWLVPLVTIVGGIGFLAWKIGRTPVSPFVYDL